MLHWHLFKVGVWKGFHEGDRWRAFGVLLGCWIRGVLILGKYIQLYTYVHLKFAHLSECMLYFFFFNLFLAVLGLSFCARAFSSCSERGGHSSSRCAGLSLSRPLLLRSTGSRRAGSVVVAHGPSCSAACGIFPDQGSNPCPLQWQADSQPLRHQGSPICCTLMKSLGKSNLREGWICLLMPCSRGRERQAAEFLSKSSLHVLS